MQLLRYEGSSGAALRVPKGNTVVSVALALERCANPDGRLESDLGLVARTLWLRPLADVSYLVN